MSAPELVAQATLAAVHRRDHAHETGCDCHPHCVEVVSLGKDAAAVCHDCGFQVGFRDQADVRTQALEHAAATK